MKYLLYLFQIIIIQYTSAQFLTLGGNNCIPNLNNNLNNGANIPIANLANGYGNGVPLANIGQTRAIELANVNSAQGNFGNEAVGNVATFPSFANIVQPPREYGIEFSADALEMGGQVEVSGRMPFNANVEVRGSVPAQGQGSVSYKCDKSADDC